MFFMRGGLPTRLRVKEGFEARFLRVINAAAMMDMAGESSHLHDLLTAMSVVA